VNDQVLFSIGEVSAIVGISRHTIRAWERRHELQPRRTPRGQRRYTADDVALLLHVKRAVMRHRVSLKVAFGSAQGDLSVPAIQESAPPGLWPLAVDLLPEMIVLLDVDGTINAANTAAAATLGLTRDDLVGRDLADLLEHSTAGTDVREQFQRACVRRTTFELDLLAISGQERWVLDCRPFSSDGEAHVAVIGRPVAALRAS
jgi:PAS domain S-box-containing protein